MTVSFKGAGVTGRLSFDFDFPYFFCTFKFQNRMFLETQGCVAKILFSRFMRFFNLVNDKILNLAPNFGYANILLEDGLRTVIQ